MPRTTSVVIPAHNEESVILRAIDGVLRDANTGEFDVVVVCNGCSDSTADVARSRSDVIVLEINEASKVAALNAGDMATDVFPRVYLDADIEVDTQSLRLVRDALLTSPAAAPLPRIDTTGATLGVRAYFAIWSRLGYVNKNLLGSGVYAMSEAGRARFGRFPDLIADDGFVYCQFSAQERVNPPGATFTVRLPRTLTSVLKRRIRITAGNLELQQRTGRRPTPAGPGWRQVVMANPRLLPAAPFYVAVNAIADIAARRRARSGTRGPWSADQSSRSGKAVAK